LARSHAKGGSYYPPKPMQTDREACLGGVVIRTGDLIIDGSVSAVNLAETVRGDKLLVFR